jgi:hypothetical protein
MKSKHSIKNQFHAQVFHKRDQKICRVVMARLIGLSAYLVCYQNLPCQMFWKVKVEKKMFARDLASQM